MRPRNYIPAVIPVLSLLLLLTASCGLFEASKETIFHSNVLLPNKLLFAGHNSNNENADLELRTLDVQGAYAIEFFGSADYDLSSPDIVKKANGTYSVAFGRTQLRVLDTFTMGVTKIDGSGSIQRALSFDRQHPSRFAYMDGSSTSGFNIIYRASPAADPVSLTSDASGSYSYWTPTWSPDGQWILYAKVPAGATSGDGCELWKVRIDGSDPEQLPITTEEVPTYATFSPDGTEIFVPGDFSSYNVANGAIGKFHNIRDVAGLLNDLTLMNFEFVGSPVTGPVHEGDAVSEMRHTFPMTAIWRPGDLLYIEALVATDLGEPPHQILGIVIFTYLRDAQRLIKVTQYPIPISEQNSEDYSISLLHPVIIP